VSPQNHISLVFGALKAWLVARSWNALIVGGLWFIGLSIIGVPWAPLWAVLGAVLQFIPNFGVMIALIGPEFAAMIKEDIKIWDAAAASAGLIGR